MKTEGPSRLYEELTRIIYKAVNEGRRLEEISELCAEFFRQQGILSGQARFEDPARGIRLIHQLYLATLDYSIRANLKKHQASGSLLLLMLETINIFLQAQVLCIKNGPDEERSERRENICRILDEFQQDFNRKLQQLKQDLKAVGPAAERDQEEEVPEEFIQKITI